MSLFEDKELEMPDEYAITGWAKLGGLIRDARLQQGISQADLATRADVARSWLARVEAGHRNAELEPLLRLLTALDLSLSLRPSGSVSLSVSQQSMAPRTAAQTRRTAWGLPAARTGEAMTDD